MNLYDEISTKLHIYEEKKADLKPTLVIPFGKHFQSESFLQPLKKRLEIFVKDEFVRIYSPSLISGKGDFSYLHENIKGLISRSAWKKYISQGYISSLPDDTNPLHIKVVFLYDSTFVDTQKETVEDIKNVLSEIKNNFGKNVSFTYALIYFCETSELPDQVEVFWPRFILSTDGMGGVKFSSEEREQTCQNLLVNLISSDLCTEIDQYFDETNIENQWIGIGASSIVVDTNEVKRNLVLKVQKSFIEPIIQAPLDPFQCEILSYQMSDIVNNIQCSLLSNENVNGEELPGVKDILDNSGWKVSIEGKNIKNCSIKLDAPIDKLIQNNNSSLLFDRNTDIQHSPKPILKRIGNFFANRFHTFVKLLKPINLSVDEDLEKVIAENYQTIFEKIQHGLSVRVYSNLRDLVKLFAYILDKNEIDRDANNIPNIIEEQDIHGFSAFEYAINKTINLLSSSADISHDNKKISPAPFATNEYWKYLAKDDEKTINDSIRRFERFNKRISPWYYGLAMLVIGSPLLYTVLDTFLTLEQHELILLCVAVLSVIWLVEFLLIRSKSYKCLEEIKMEILSNFENHVLGIITRVFCDYRLLTTAHLQKIQQLFTDVNRSLNEVLLNIDSNLKTDKLMLKPNMQSMIYPVNSAKRIYGTESLLVEGDFVEEWSSLSGELASLWRDEKDNKAILSWVSEARKIANVDAIRENILYPNIETSIMFNSLTPLFTNVDAPIEIIKQFQTKAIYYAEQVMNPLLLGVGLLSEEDDGLKNGKKWRWLFSNAHPLCRGEGKNENNQSFTIMIVPNAEVLQGPTGVSSDNWNKDWNVIYSNKNNELSCLRCVVIEQK